MPAAIRTATFPDVPSMVELLIQDARRREAHNAALWRLAVNAREKIEEAVTFALTAGKQPSRQNWLVAEADGKLVGIVHSLLLPVPPIYAGKWGEPGLLMPETFVAQDAPPGTSEALIETAEADLGAAGAKLFLASFVCGQNEHAAFRGRGYEPLTLYLSKSDFETVSEPADVRAASEEDIEEIVALSAEHRAILHELDVFWTPHPEANPRFESWMKKSLSFKDREMLVAGPPEALEGYVIAQPASRLHFPPSHDISATGAIDDFFHRQYADPALVHGGGKAAQALLQVAEASFAGRGITTAFVVCPAAWTSKITLLENAGYKTAMIWMIKR